MHGGSLNITLSRLKTDIVLLMNVPQHKCVGVDNRTIWTDDYVTPKTADNTDVSLVAVRCSKKNQMIAPCTIFPHTLQVLRP